MDAKTTEMIARYAQASENSKHAYADYSQKMATARKTRASRNQIHREFSTDSRILAFNAATKELSELVDENSKTRLAKLCYVMSQQVMRQSKEGNNVIVGWYGSGHTCNDSPIYAWYPTKTWTEYLYPSEEREAAKGELIQRYKDSQGPLKSVTLSYMVQVIGLDELKNTFQDQLRPELESLLENIKATQIMSEAIYKNNDLAPDESFRWIFFLFREDAWNYMIATARKNQLGDLYDNARDRDVKSKTARALGPTDHRFWIQGIRDLRNMSKRTKDKVKAYACLALVGSIFATGIADKIIKSLKEKPNKSIEQKLDIDK